MTVSQDGIVKRIDETILGLRTRSYILRCTRPGLDGGNGVERRERRELEIN